MSTPNATPSPSGATSSRAWCGFTHRSCLVTLARRPGFCRRPEEGASTGIGDEVRDWDRRVRRKRRLRGVALGAVIATAATFGVFGTAGANAPSQGGGGKPKSGGSITYGLEAPTTNFCLPNAQLAISGIVVTTAIYDTLTVPDNGGKYVPYLAESVNPSLDSMSWTIKLRPNIQFQNGEALDANAVKQNLDAYAGKNSAVSAPLFGFVMSNVDS